MASRSIKMTEFRISPSERQSVLAMKAHHLRGRQRVDDSRPDATQLVGVRLWVAAFVLRGNGRATPCEGSPSPHASPSQLPARHRRPLAAFDHRVLDVGVAGRTNQSNNSGRAASHRDRAERGCASTIHPSARGRTAPRPPSLGCSRLPRIADRCLFDRTRSR